DRFPLFYQWLLNGRGIPGATNDTLSLTNIDAHQSGKYSVLVQNWFGGVTNDVAEVDVEVPYLTAERVATNGMYRISLPWSLDHAVELQSSPDLIHWETI